MSARAAASLASLLMLAGCYTVDSTRASAPARTAEIDGDYRSLAACLTRANQRHLQASMVVDEPAQTASVLTVMDNGYARVPIAETTLRAVSPTRTAVDIRAQHRSLAGRAVNADADWDTLQTCSQAAQAAPSQR